MTGFLSELFEVVLSTRSARLSPWLYQISMASDDDRANQESHVDPKSE